MLALHQSVCLQNHFAKLQSLEFLRPLSSLERFHYSQTDKSQIAEAANVPRLSSPANMCVSADAVCWVNPAASEWHTGRCEVTRRDHLPTSFEVAGHKSLQNAAGEKHGVGGDFFSCIENGSPPDSAIQSPPGTHQQAACKAAWLSAGCGQRNFSLLWKGKEEGVTRNRKEPSCYYLDDPECQLPSALPWVGCQSCDGMGAGWWKFTIYYRGVEYQGLKVIDVRKCQD